MSQEHWLRQLQLSEGEVRALKTKVKLLEQLLKLQEETLQLLKDRLREREGHIGFLEQTLKRLSVEEQA